MENILDATDISDLVLPEFLEATTESPSEQMIGETITSLWSEHLNAKNTARATNEELRVLRAKLGEQLSEMKQMLSKPAHVPAAATSLAAGPMTTAAARWAKCRPTTTRPIAWARARATC